MGTPTFKKDKLIHPKDRIKSANLVGNFIAAVPPEVVAQIALKWEVAPLQLQRDISVAITVLAAEAGNTEAREVIRKLKRGDRKDGSERPDAGVIGPSESPTEG